MTRPESDDDLSHDWHIDGEHATPGSLPFWCPDCLSMAPARLDALCPDRVKRAIDRRFLAGVQAGLHGAVRRISIEAAQYEDRRYRAAENARFTELESAVGVCDHLISVLRAIDPATLTEKP